MKRLDPITAHKNDGDYVGVVLDHKEFKGKMWIRKTELNRNKKGENIKQYSYGQECITYTRNNLSNIITFVWNKVDKKSNFYKDNSTNYNLVMENLKPMKKKEAKCQFIQDIMKYLNEAKIDGKVWFKKLKL